MGGLREASNEGGREGGREVRGREGVTIVWCKRRNETL